MLTKEEELELQALEQEMRPQTQAVSRSVAAPDRRPGDLENPNIQVMTPEEEAELNALEQDFGQRPQPGQPEGKSLITQAGEAYDRFSGSASLRRGIGEYQDSGSLMNAANAFIDQFSRPADQAPTGKEIALKAGLNDEHATVKRNPMQVADEARAFNRPVAGEQKAYSQSDVAGLGVDIVADPLSLIPFGVLYKSGAKGARAALKGSAKAADIATGTKFIRAGEAVGDAAKAAAESTKSAKIQLSKLFKPDIAPDFKNLKAIAEKNGIATDWLPEAVEFGENSVISRHARNTAEGPLGGDSLQKFEKFTQDVSNAAENNIAKIGGGYVPGKQEAGRLIREGFDEGVDRFFQGMGETYGNALKLAPDLKLDPKSSKILSSNLNELEMWAKGRIGRSADAEKVLNNPLAKKGDVTKATNEMLNVMDSTHEAITNTQKAQAQEVLQAVKVVRNAVQRSGGSLQQVYSAMREIGDIAFKSKNSLAEVPSDVRKFQDLYFKLQKGATESIRSGLGDDFAKALEANNSEMSKFFTHRGRLTNVIGNKNLADEKVFESLIMRGDSQRIDDLKSIISQENFNKLKASYLDNMVVRDADGVINFNSTRKKLNLQKDKLKNIYSADELESLDEVLKLGDRAGKPVLSSSGTGASNMFKDLVGTMQSKIGGDVLIENLKKGARSRANYVENVAESGKPRTKSGIELLREASPVSKKQGAKGAQVQSIQNRNERLEKFKQMRGIK